MADPIEAGTPPTETPGSESAGTGAQAVDGSESQGKPIDPALAMAWKAKAEKYNELEDRVRNAEARLAYAQNQQFAAQQQANPLQEMVAELQQAAPYDVNARASLAALTIQATQQAETDVLRAMMRQGIPPARQDAVAGIIRNSGYRVSVEQADQMARGSEVPDLAKQLEAERARSAALEKALSGRTVGGGTQGNPASTVPAAASAGDNLEVTMDEYLKLPKELRDKARIRR